MPIVLTYDNIAVLGQLAIQTGQAQGVAARNAQNLQYLAQTEQSRNQTAAQLQEIQARERMQQQQLQYDWAARQQQMQAQASEQAGNDQYRYATLAEQKRQFDTNTGLTSQRMDQDQRQFDAGLANAQGIQKNKTDAQILMEQQQADAALQKQREANMFKLQYGGQQTTGYQQGGPGQAHFTGGMTKAQMDAEVQNNAKLIPYATGKDNSDAKAMIQDRSEKQKIADQIAQTPTPQLIDFAKSNPSDPWATYIRAVILHRQSTQPSTPGTSQYLSTGAQPGVWSIPSQQQPSSATAPLSSSAGYADPRFSRLTDEELLLLTQNQALLQQFMSGK